MRVLITNDDGPPHDEFSPYIITFVKSLKELHKDWSISVVVPSEQKSWIGKAHLAGKTITAKYIYTENDSECSNAFLGPFTHPQFHTANSKLPCTDKLNPNKYIEWCLLDGTPATCVNIGLNHLFDQKFDLVISGPNVGRNTSIAYITSSGTVGAAMEAVISNDIRSLALSWAYYDGKKVVSDDLMKIASKKSIQVIDHLLDNWNENADLYSINLPLCNSLSLKNTKVFYAPIWENRWSSVYTTANIKQTSSDSQEIEDGSKSHEITFDWCPKFKTRNSKHYNGSSNILTDMQIIEKEMVSVTPLRACYKMVDNVNGEIILDNQSEQKEQVGEVVVSIDPNEYIYKPITQALKKYMSQCKIISNEKSASSKKIIHYGDYENLDMEKLMYDSENYFANSYIYRKALIRKHYLAETIHGFVVKNCTSILNKSFLETYTLDLDYAEFLDDSLDENWELRQELEKKEKWWILKPSMSDKAQGIRVFQTIEDLQEIFNSFDEDDTDDEVMENLDDSNKIIISQLRHFIIQEYLTNPLLLPSMGNRKFHIRCYIVCNGNLEVYVYDRMLALFAPTIYENPNQDSFDLLSPESLQCHLTNTCLQQNNKSLSVMEFNQLKDLPDAKKKVIRNQIHDIAHDLFLAATSVNRINFQPLPNAFETYGVDFLVDSNYNVKLLEVNAYPDFKQTGDNLKGLIDQLFDNIVPNCIIPKINQNFVIPKDNLFTKVLDHKSNEWNQ